jgi:phosphoserine/homoserine phosphotransferase
MKIACLDFEGVLVPEIWVNLAEQTNIEELRVTTRDIADYDELMRFRLDLMAKHGLSYADLNKAAEKLEPLPGALEFLVWLRSNYQVAITV